MKRVVFNGETGGLGRFFADALRHHHLDYTVLKSRLEDNAGINIELDKIITTADDDITLVPLAGLVPVVVCEKEPDRAFKTNVIDTTALVMTFLSWAERRGVIARVLYVSTGHIYAPKTGQQTLAETDPVLPRSVYARTKLQAEDALRDMFKNKINRLLIARVFGLLSPTQTVPYVLPSLIRRVIDKNFANMGGLDCVRDYLDARDVCRLLVGLCHRDWPASDIPGNRVINIASGEGSSIQQVFGMALEAGGTSWAAVEKQITTSPARADDIAYMVGDATRVSKLLATTPRQIPLRQTITEAFKNQ